MKERIVILGAAGRDFHNFNTVFRGRGDCQVVAFTATQIPNIDDRRYPASLAGPGYPEGIPIVPEAELEPLIRDKHVDRAVFAYSDVSYDYVMSLASRVQAAGADFSLLGPNATMIHSAKPVVAVCAVRTGAGKSQSSRYVARLLQEAGLRTVVIRHPMPYGDLKRQAVQRFAEMEDLARHDTTIEEREEYEPHLAEGRIVYAGVDYGAILEQAEAESDVIVWDGGNNDLSFYRPDVQITVLDPFRPEDVAHYYPGETNVRLADILLVNKCGTAGEELVEQAVQAATARNPEAVVVRASSPPRPEDPEALTGKRVLVIEDGPTLTHGGMPFGAGTVAALDAQVSERVDPHPFAVGSIKETLERFPHLESVLPAMGYGEAQMAELAETVQRSDADLVVAATPIDLRRVIDFDKPVVRVRYDLEDAGTPTLADALAPWLSEWSAMEATAST